MTIDDRLYWTFKYEQAYYGTRLRRSNSLRVTENAEVFLDDTEGNIIRKPISISYILNCSSWKQALLFVFYCCSSSSYIRVNVKNESAIIGWGLLARLDGTVLLECSKHIIDRSLVTSNAPSTSLEGTFLKCVLPIMVSCSTDTLQIKNSSSLSDEGAKPKLIGNELNKELIECAKNSLELIDL